MHRGSRKAQLHGVTPQAQHIHHLTVSHFKQIVRRPLANGPMVRRDGRQAHMPVAAVNQHAGFTDIHCRSWICGSSIPRRMAAGCPARSFAPETAGRRCRSPPARSNAGEHRTRPAFAYALDHTVVKMSDRSSKARCGAKTTRLLSSKRPAAIPSSTPSSRAHASTFARAFHWYSPSRQGPAKRC